MGMSNGTITVTVNKDELLEILINNRDKHVEEYKEAFEGWKVHVLQELDAEKAKFIECVDDKHESFGMHIAMPSSHERDYTRVIDMLKMHQGKEFTIDSNMYTQYVDDEWAWSAQFARMSATYKK